MSEVKIQRCEPRQAYHPLQENRLNYITKFSSITTDFKIYTIKEYMPVYQQYGKIRGGGRN